MSEGSNPCGLRKKFVMSGAIPTAGLNAPPENEPTDFAAAKTVPPIAIPK